MFNLITYWGNIENVLHEEGLFKGKIVVDLGAGKEPWGFFMALHGNASGYIAVEPHSDCATQIASRIGGATNCWTAVIQEDAETFLPRLPSNSVSFIISGFSRELNNRRPETFFQNMKKNLERCMASDATVLWYESDPRFLPNDIGKLVEPTSRKPILYCNHEQQVIDPARFLKKSN